MENSELIKKIFQKIQTYLKQFIQFLLIQHSPSLPLKINTTFKSRWFNNRPPGTVIDTIVLHYTVLNKADTLAVFCNDTGNKVSAHYVIDESGEVLQLVDEPKRAWHAGVSAWNGKESLNHNSIGIEIVNNGSSPFTDSQYRSLIALCHDLRNRYPIPHQNIVGHSDISPERKIDPGTFFDWHRLSKNGIGLFPDLGTVGPLAPIKLIGIGDQGSQTLLLQQRLNQLGYHLKKDQIFGKKTGTIIKAFKTHYCQGLSKTSIDTNWDTLAEKALNDLLMQLTA